MGWKILGEVQTAKCDHVDEDLYQHEYTHLNWMIMVVVAMVSIFIIKNQCEVARGTPLTL